MSGLTSRIDTDELRDLGDRARSLAASLGDVADPGSAPSASAVGHAELASAIAALRRASRQRTSAVATHMAEVGDHLTRFADGADALDALLAGLGRP